MYKQHLNTIVRYASQKVPEQLGELGQAHDISHILQKIRSEPRKGKHLALLRALKAGWKFREANTETAGTGRGGEIPREDGGMLFQPRPKAGILKLFRKW